LELSSTIHEEAYQQTIRIHIGRITVPKILHRALDNWNKYKVEANWSSPCGKEYRMVGVSENEGSYDLMRSYMWPQMFADSEGQIGAVTAAAYIRRIDLFPNGHPNEQQQKFLEEHRKFLPANSGWFSDYGSENGDASRSPWLLVAVWVVLWQQDKCAFYCIPDVLGEFDRESLSKSPEIKQKRGRDRKQAKVSVGEDMIFFRSEQDKGNLGELFDEDFLEYAFSEVREATQFPFYTPLEYSSD